MTEPEHGPEAFESVAKPHLPLLWRCARRLVQTGHEAEDLVQETCLKAFRAWHQLQPGTDARAWLGWRRCWHPWRPTASACDDTSSTGKHS